MADLGDLVLQLKLDDSQYTKSINEAEQRAQGLKDVNVGLNPDRSFQSTTQRIRELQRERVKLTAQLDTTNAFNRLNDEIAKIERRRLRLDANVTGINAQLQKVESDIQRLETQRIRLQSDPSATIQDIQDLANRIDILDARRIKLNLNRQEALSDINTIETRLNQVEDERVNIDINAQNAALRIAQIDEELNKAGNSTDTFRNRFGALQGVIAGASAAIIDNLIQIGARLADIPRQLVAISLGNFRDFDAELQQFSALTGQSRDEMKDLTDEIQRLGIETTKAPTELAALSNQLIAIGASKDEIDELLSSVVALSEATNTDLVSAGSTLFSGTTVFGFDADQLADDLTTLRNTTATTVTDIDQLIAKVGGTFNALGDAADPQELLAYFATLRDGKLPAEEAATGIRGVTAALVDSAKAAEIEALGVDAFDDVTGEFLGYEAVLRQIQQTQSELNPEEFTRRIVDAFGREGLPAITTALKLLDSNFTNTFSNIQNNSNSAVQSASTLTQGFAGSLKILQGSLETLSIAFGGALAPLVQFFAEGLTQLANQLLTTEGIFDPITQAIERFKTSLTGNPELLASITDGLIQLIGLGIDGLAGVFNTIANFFSNQSNVTAFAESFGQFVQAVISIGQLAGVVVSVTTAIAGLFNAVSQLGQSVPIVKIAFDQFLNPLSTLQGIATLLKPLLDGVRVALNLTSSVVDNLTAPFQLLSNVLDGVIGRIRSLLGQLAALRAEGGVSTVGTAATDAALQFFDDISPRKHGGPVIPGKTYLAGEAGPELVKMGDATGIIQSPSLLRFDQPGRIYSAPKTRQKLSNTIKSQSLPSQVAKMNKLLLAISRQRGDVNTSVNIEGVSPDDIRRQLAYHQIDVYRGLGY